MRVIDVRTPDLPAGAPLRACFDAARLGQALGNLLGNAVQHGAAGPVTVTVAAAGAAPAPMPALAAGPVVIVAVHSGGPPIAAAQLDGLFNPLQSRDAAGAGRRRADRQPGGAHGARYTRPAVPPRHLSCGRS